MGLLKFISCLGTFLNRGNMTRNVTDKIRNLKNY